MFPAPKGLSLGCDADGKFTLLYVGDDYAAARDTIEKHPKDVHQIWLFRNGVLTSTKETPTSRVIRTAKLAHAQKVSDDAWDKAMAAAKAKEAASKKKTKDLNAAAQAKGLEEAKAAAHARKKRDADLLEAAAAKAKSDIADTGEEEQRGKGAWDKARADALKDSPPGSIKPEKPHKK